MSIRSFCVCGILFLLLANGASAARYQRTKDGKTIVWNNLRGVAQEVTWSGLRDTDGYATGEGTLTWYRLTEVVNSYTGKMVHGKFEGPVVKEQGQTRLQANFVNGEKTGGWSEPGAIETHTPTPTPAPAPKQESPKPVETPVAEEPVGEQLLPTPIPSPSPSRSLTPRVTPTATPSPTSTPVATPMPTPVPTRSPAATPTPTATASPSPTPNPSSSPTPSPTSTLTPPQLKSFPSPAVQEPTNKDFRLEEVVQGPARDSLKLGTPAPGLRDALEEAPALERSTSSPSASAAPQAAGSKEQMIAQFKKQTESVLAQVRDATGNFSQIDRIDKVTAFPAAVSASIASLAERSRDFRAKLGYAVAFYECGAETATVDALVAVDEATRDWSQKNAPVGRSKLVNFFMRYPNPTRDNQKPLWRYNGSMLIAFNDVKKKAEDHLQRAKSFEAAGKKSEALREYKEINRIYPNTITEEKIKQLESSPR